MTQVNKIARKDQNVTEKIKTEVGTYALIHGTKTALERFNKIYPKYTFPRTSIKDWKFRIKKDKEVKNIFKRKSQPNLLSDDLMAKVKTIIIETRGTAISRRMVMAIGNGAVKSNNPILLKENGRSLQLTEEWARGVLKSMNWVKRKGTTRKIKSSQQFLLEDKLFFQKKISGAIFYHDIPKELIANLDQTPLSYVSPGANTLLTLKVLKPFLLKVSTKTSDNCYICYFNAVEFLPIQVIYEGKTTRCLTKYAFPENFNLKFSENNCSNTEKAISFFEKVVFIHFKKIRQIKGYPNEQMSLVIMDTFKGQDNEDVAEVCRNK